MLTHIVLDVDVPLTDSNVCYDRRGNKMKKISAKGCIGKTAYFCICYENSKGESGEFGPIFSAVIP
jgi:hypothetical protein